MSSPITLENLYSDHHRWLQGWLCKRLGNDFDAADLAHDAFVLLLAKPRHFNNSPQARVYLRTMANGLYVDLQRRRAIEQAWLDALAAQPESVAPSAEHQAMVLEALQEIDTMLGSLPPKIARAFMLAVVGDMTHKEVAAVMGVTTRTITTYIAQAMLHCLRLEARQMAQAPTHGGQPVVTSACKPVC